MMIGDVLLFPLILLIDVCADHDPEFLCFNSLRPSDAYMPQ